MSVGYVKGVPEAIAALEQFVPDLHDDITDEMKSVADDMAAQVEGNMPGDAPMSGFNHEGRTSWSNRGGASAQEVEGWVAGAGDWPVYKIVLSGPAACMTDIAGAGSRGMTPEGANMTSVLNSRFGRASRWVWPVAKANMGKVENAMSDAADAASEQASAKMSKGS